MCGANRRAAGPGIGARRDRRVVPGNPGLAGAHRRELPAGCRYLTGRAADRPEDGQRVHPGHRAGRTRLGQARCRRSDPRRAEPGRGSGISAAHAGAARASLPVRPAQGAGVRRHHAVMARRQSCRGTRPPGSRRDRGARGTAPAQARGPGPAGPGPGADRNGQARRSRRGDTGSNPVRPTGTGRRPPGPRDRSGCGRARRARSRRAGRGLPGCLQRRRQPSGATVAT